MKRWIALLGLVAACSPAPTPVALAPRSSPLSCANALPTFGFDAAPRGDRTPVAGQMTEEAAQAKRLFDREHWGQAVTALERVINGDTGDDEGNKQLAAYHRAVALYHGGRVGDAAAAFLAIAGRPAHLKHPETILWLVKLADAAPVVVRGMAYYDLSSAKPLDNAYQGETYQGALFIMGRERFEQGAGEEARDLLSRVTASSRWYPLARECLDRLPR